MNTAAWPHFCHAMLIAKAAAGRARFLSRAFDDSVASQFSTECIIAANSHYVASIDSFQPPIQPRLLLYYTMVPYRPNSRCISPAILLTI